MWLLIIIDTFIPPPIRGGIPWNSWWVCIEGPQNLCVIDCHFIVNVLDLRFAGPIAIYR